MDTVKLAHWLQIVGNLGLIAGLVLVALQLRQTYELEISQQISDSSESHVPFNIAAMGEGYASAHAKAALTPETLTAEDVSVLRYAMEARWMQLARSGGQRSSGTYNDETLHIEARNTGAYFFGATSFGKAWWRERYEGVPAADLTDWERIVDEVVENGDGQRIARQLRVYAKAVGATIE